MIKLSEHVKDEEITPVCPLFGECGGCDFQHIPYTRELLIKEKSLQEALKDVLDKNSLSRIVPSPKEYHYRHRIDLKLQRTKGEVLIGFTPKSGRGILSVDNCPIAEEAICKGIARVKGEALKKLTDKYIQANLTLRTSQDGRVHWGGIGKRSLRMKEEDYLSIELLGKKIYFSMETFFQANLSILPELIRRIRALDVWKEEFIFFDLYGGVGLFAISLYDLAKEVYLIEEVPMSIEMAQYNKARNNLEKLQIIKGRVEDNMGEIIRHSGKLNTIAMIDPPRSGLSNEARQFFTQNKMIDTLLYLSCNPQALAEDLKAFVTGNWLIKEVIPFDFFPRTKHIETLVVLQKEKTYVD